MGLKHEFKIPKMSPQEARNMTEKAWASYRDKYKQYNPNFLWKSPGVAAISFKANGVEIKGILALESEKISMDMEVPFLLRSFMPQALKAIEEEIEKWIPKPAKPAQTAAKPAQAPSRPAQAPNPSPTTQKVQPGKPTTPPPRHPSHHQGHPTHKTKR